MSSPTRRAALAVGVAALLVTAGCLGGTSPTDTDAASAPETTNCTYDPTTTTTETGTYSPDVSVEQYPPGVADNGTLVNASTLVDTHFAATANESVALTVDWRAPSQNFTRRLVQGPEPSEYYSTWVENPADSDDRVTHRLYVDGSRHYLYWTAENETVDNEMGYQVGQNASDQSNTWTKDDSFGPRFSVQNFLGRGNYTVNGTVERGGQTFVQLTADDGAPIGARDSYVTFDGTMLVTPEGVVHEVDESFATGANGTVEERFEGALHLNTDIEWCGAPSWTADLPHLSLSIVEGGRAVEIRNTGGAALPANTTFDVTGGEQPHYGTEGHPSRGEVKGTVTTDEHLEPGEAVYVTAGVNGTASSFALHDDPTRGEYNFGNAGLTGGHGDFWYWLATGIEPWSEAE